MLDREEEYIKMSKVEEQHWWYISLHSQVLAYIKAYFTDSQIKILDAGCGTGGLIRYLQAHGYHHFSGFDISPTGIEFAKKKCQLPALQVGDLRSMDKYYAPNTFDVIVSNDVLYFLNPEEQRKFLQHSYELLNSSGILILNLPCFEAFRGIHDISVGIQQRFHPSIVKKIVNGSGFQIQKRVFWPFLLSPLILLARWLQRLKLRFYPDLQVKSDIDLPGDFANTALKKLFRLENTLLPAAPFGSSMLLVLKK